MIDELTGIVAVLLTLSCVFSFTSIRTTKEKKKELFETVADYVFLVSLIGILIIILLIAFDIIEIS